MPVSHQSVRTGRARMSCGPIKPLRTATALSSTAAPLITTAVSWRKCCASPLMIALRRQTIFGKRSRFSSQPRRAASAIRSCSQITQQGRTFVTQEESQAGATTDVTDDDGQQLHAKHGGGRIRRGSTTRRSAAARLQVPTPNPTPSHPHAVYYASQSVSHATASRSDDGGITFGPAFPMYNVVDCDGLHGHIKVAPDGTVYVPDKACSVNGVPFVLGETHPPSSLKITGLPGRPARFPTARLRANGIHPSAWLLMVLSTSVIRARPTTAMG